MKKKWFGAIAVCCAFISAAPVQAQQYADPVVETVTPNLAEDGTGGGKYYIYHVAFNRWLSAGARSGTQLIVDTVGQEITLVYGEERPGLYGQKPKVSGKGWIFNMLNGPTNDNRFHEVYMTGINTAYVDCGTEGHTLFDIIKNEDNNYYRIKVVEQDTTFSKWEGVTYERCFWGVVATDTANWAVQPMVDKVQAGMETGEQDWQFVTPDAYARYMAKKELQKALNYAVESGYTDRRQYETVYNDPDADAADVEEATCALQQAVNDQLGAGATEEKPLDFTYLITNPDFDQDGLGWTDTETSVALGFGNDGNSYTDPDDPSIRMSHFCEKYQAAPASTPMYTYQVLHNMPQGRYRLGAYTLAYNQANYQGNNEGVYLFADSYRAAAHTVEFDGVADKEDTNPPVPCPRNVTVDFYSRGGDITIGMMSTENTACNWMGFDHVTLIYLGNEGGVREAVLNEVENMEQYLTEVGETAICSSATMEEFQQAVNHSRELAENSATTDEELDAALMLMNSQRDSVEASISYYANAKATMDRIATELMGDGSYQEMGLTFPQTEAFYFSMDEAYNGRTLTVAQINGMWDEANRIFREELAGYFASGDITDLTGMMINPDFSNGASEGWEKTGNGNLGNGGETKVSEVWNGKDWEVSQELQNLPEGFYKISAQAFYAPYSLAGNAATSGKWHASYGETNDQVNAIKGFIFANDASSPLCHIAQYAQDSNYDMSNDFYVLDGMAKAPQLEGKFVPATLSGTSVVFAADAKNYRDSVSCYVGEDGVLRLGVRMSGVTEDNAWVAYDNFEVTYLGLNDTQSAKSTINAKLSEANTLSGQSCMVSEAKAGLLDAISTTQKFVMETTEITGEQFVQIMDELNTAIENFNTANETFGKLEELVKMYLPQKNAFLARYDADLVEELMELVSEVNDMIAANTPYETLDEVTAMTEDINVVYGDMVSAGIDFTTGTKDEPVDVTGMLKNPSFQEEVNDSIIFNYRGWNVENEQGNANVGDSVFEFYNTKFADIHQAVYGLKKGYYRLALSGFYRDGSNEEAAVAHHNGTEDIRAYAYATTPESMYEVTGKPLASQLDGVHNLLYAASDVQLDDSLFNDGEIYHIVPNDRAGARAAFYWGEYEVTMSFYVEKDNDPIYLGVRKNDGVNMDWTCIDDFHLYYLGDGEENRPDDMGSLTGVEETVTENVAEVVASQWYTLNGVQVSQPGQRGVYIRVDWMSDGSKKAVKVMVR